MIFELINVKSYCEYRPDQQPLSFSHKNKRVKLSEIVDGWNEEGGKSRLKGGKTPGHLLAGQA